MPLGYYHQVTRTMLCDEWADAYHLQRGSLWWRGALFIQVQVLRLAVMLERWAPWWARFRRRRAQGAVMLMFMGMLGGHGRVSFYGGNGVGGMGEVGEGGVCPMTGGGHE